MFSACLDAQLRFTPVLKYYNVANQYLNDLPSGSTYGNGPFREVRMLVDGQLAGVAFPYVFFKEDQSKGTLTYCPVVML